MDAGERRLFRDALHQIVEAHDGAELDAALVDLGWLEAFDEDPAEAIPPLFDALGASGASSALLHHVLGGAALTGLGPSAVWLGPPPEGASGRPIAGVDVAAHLHEVTGLTSSYDADALRLGQLALAHQLVGSGRAMLALARTHALDRVQFGVPISSFQAVRHKLAETFVILEAADGLITAAWSTADAQDAAMAKGLAGRAARTASKHAQQVLAGIGFTTEHRFHLYARRVLLLDQLLGSSKTLTTDLGSALLTLRALPPLPPL